MRTAMHLRAEAEAAEDAVQETYLQAWKYWHTFQPGTNCRAWLFRILFNVIKKSYAKEKETAQWDDSLGGNVLWFEGYRQTETYEVLEVFDRLTTEHRAVLILIAVEEMSYKEAASVLEVPIGTVMSRLNRARAELRHLLGHPGKHSSQNAIGIRQ
jgi:RNA polymerase sigma-70 factor (ECF subfamily)